MPTMPPVRNAMWKPRSRTAATGGRGDADVGPGRQRHADVADGGRERGADKEEQCAADADVGRAVGDVHRQDEHQDEDDDREDREGAELAVQVGRRALLHRLGDLLHLRRALVGLEDLADQAVREARAPGGR